MKNILVMVGSNKKGGNTELLADAFISGAKSAGHVVTKVFLGDTKINGCSGCNACRKVGSCIQKDDMAGVYPLIEQADSIVFASPLYYWTISAGIKAFIERLYAVAKEDPNPPLGRYEKYPNKECALLVTAADDLFWTFEQVTSYYQFAVVNYIGWRDKGMVLAGGCGGSGSERCIRQTPHLETAYRFGERF